MRPLDYSTVWGDRWGLEEDRAGAWPTADQFKRRHLEQLQAEIDDLKDAAESQKMQDEWQQMEQELPK